MRMTKTAVDAALHCSTAVHFCSILWSFRRNRTTTSAFFLRMRRTRCFTLRTPENVALSLHHTILFVFHPSSRFRSAYDFAGSCSPSLRPFGVRRLASRAAMSL